MHERLLLGRESSAEEGGWRVMRRRTERGCQDEDLEDHQDPARLLVFRAHGSEEHCDGLPGASCDDDPAPLL